MEDLTDSVQELKIVGSPPESHLFAQLKSSWPAQTNQHSNVGLTDRAKDSTLTDDIEKRHKFRSRSFHGVDERKIFQFGPIPEKDPSEEPSPIHQCDQTDNAEQTVINADVSAQQAKLIKPKLTHSASNPVSSASQTWQWFHAAFKAPVKSLSRNSSSSSLVSMGSETNEDCQGYPCMRPDCHKLHRPPSLREINSMSPTSW